MSIFTSWKTWKKEAGRWAKHRSHENIEAVDQNFVNKYIDGSEWQYENPWTIAGERARFSMGRSGASSLYNKQGTWIDENNWDGWTLQSASLIRDPQGRFDRFECGPKFLATAWTQDDSKTVYVGLHHWGSLDPDGNKIPNGTHIKDLGYFEPTDNRYEGVERWFEYDFNGDEIVNGKAWSEPEGPSYGVRRIGGTPPPTRSPRQAPSRDELEPIGMESTGMNPSLDDELTRMMFPGASYEPITAVEALF